MNVEEKRLTVFAGEPVDFTHEEIEITVAFGWPKDKRDLLSDHLDALFDWLCENDGENVWITLGPPPVDAVLDQGSTE